MLFKFVAEPGESFSEPTMRRAVRLGSTHKMSRTTVSPAALDPKHEGEETSLSSRTAPSLTCGRENLEQAGREPSQLVDPNLCLKTQALGDLPPGGVDHVGLLGAHRPRSPRRSPG